MLGPHQQVDRAQAALLVEQLEHVRLAVHHRHRPRAAQPGGQLGAVLQPARPALRLALRGGLVLLRPAVRCLVLDQRHPQRHAVPIDDQRRVHVQPERALRVGVLADQAQALAAGMLGEVEIGAVLDAQQRFFAAHALERAGAVRGEDVRGSHRRVGGLVDQAVVGFHQGLVGLGGGRERGPGRGGEHGGAARQAPAQAYIAQGGRAELEGGPAGPVESGDGAGQRPGVGEAELAAPVGAQGIEEDRLDGDGGAGRGRSGRGRRCVRPGSSWRP